MRPNYIKHRYPRFLLTYPGTSKPSEVVTAQEYLKHVGAIRGTGHQADMARYSLMCLMATYHILYPYVRKSFPTRKLWMEHLQKHHFLHTHFTLKLDKKLSRRDVKRMRVYSTSVVASDKNPDRQVVRLDLMFIMGQI